MGKISLVEIDNFLSLVDRIIFQLENNTENQSQYINQYFLHPLLSEDNKHFKEFGNHYTDFAASIKKFRAITKPKDRTVWIDENRKNLLLKLKKFRTHLKKNMFGDALKSIISYLKCPHTVEEHKEDIEYCTEVIATELFYERKSRADIQELFNKIMSDNIHQFPFCPSFFKENKKNLNAAKKKFLKNRTFDQQFQGIFNFLNEQTHKHFYVFRIGNIISDPNFKYKTQDIEIYSPDTKKIKTIERTFQKRRKSYMIPFFKPEFGLYIIVRQPSKIKKDHQKEALNNALISLDNLNRVCNTSAFLDKHSFLYTSDFKNIGGSLSFMDNPSFLNRHNIDDLINDNIYYYLQGKPAKAKRQFLAAEEQFIKAKNTGDLDDYWKYLENLIGKPVKETFVSIVSKPLFEREKILLEVHIRNCLNNAYKSGTSSMTREEYWAMMEEIRASKNVDFSKWLSKIDIPFLRNLISKHSGFNNSNREYIARTINELYEQRNFMQHSVKRNEKAILKLLETIPPLIAIFRYELINQMINKPKSTFTEILQPYKAKKMPS